MIFSQKKQNKENNKDDKKKEKVIIRKINDPKSPLISLKNIKKHFKDNLVLKGINLDIYPGEKIGLLGSNGAGKTTLSEIIVGLIHPSSGTIEYNFQYQKNPKEHLGMQFQESTFPSGLKVKNLIKFIKGIRDIDITNEEVFEMMKIFNMEHLFNKSSRSMSGGERQKINILLSLIHNPKFVVLDELTTGLDIVSRENIIEFTNKLLSKNNTAMILVSHHMSEMEELCDKVVIIDNGEIGKILKMEDVIKKHQSLQKFASQIIKKDLDRKGEAWRQKQKAKAK